ncbi:MAG TPA: ATP-binding protein [Longimicrobium sp.]|nr:ATP-binding protein [Longimicrobium sp.]
MPQHHQVSLRDQLHAAVLRVDALRARATRASTSPMVQETLEELLTAMEELRVTEEELRLQTEAVAAGQARVEEEHHRYLALFHFAPDPYLVTDLEGTIREANRAAGTLLGVRESRLRGKPLAVFVDPDGARSFRAALAGIPARDRVEGWEVRLVPRGGAAALEVSCTVAVARSRAGRAEGLRWMLRDVTGRREAEERARRLEADAAAHAEAEAGRRRLAAVLEGTCDAFFSVDPAWRLAYVNRRAEELWGKRRGDVLGRSLWELFPQAAGAEGERAVRRAMEGRRAVHVEALSPVLGRWMEIQAFPVDGGLSVFVRDVHERHRRQAADRLLTRAGELLAESLDPAATLQSVADLAAGTLADYCIVHVREDGRVHAPGVAHADPTRRELLLGVLRRFPVDPEGPHPSLATLRTGEARLLPTVEPSLLEAISTGPEHLEMLRALGLTSALVVPIRLRGETLGAISLARTSGPAYDEGDLAVAEDLARRAALALDNARAYDRAREASRAREEVLAVVSHDLRNPLNAVLLAATILDDYTDPEKWTERERRQLKAIRGSAQQMTTLIGDLVEVVALESGQRVLRLEGLAPDALLADAAELHRGLAAQKGIALEAEPAPGLPEVRADRGRVLQVLSNLLGNAIKFTPGGGTVTMGAAPRGDGVGFFVSDTGPGIPPEQLASVFDRFWQAERGDRKGLGLGLAIARGIVEAHGGRIWAESVPGRGSTFFFTLPVAGPG